MSYTDDDKALFLRLLEASGLNISEAVRRFNEKYPGFARRTFYYWADYDPKFADALDDLNEAELDESESLHKLHRKGVPKYLYVPKMQEDGTPKLASNGKQVYERAIDGDGQPVQIGWLIPPQGQRIEWHLIQRGAHRGYRSTTDINVNFPSNPYGKRVTGRAANLPDLDNLSDDELDILEGLLSRASSGGDSLPTGEASEE